MWEHVLMLQVTNMLAIALLFGQVPKPLATLIFIDTVYITMKTLIKLKIEQFEEQGKEYFVATSDELQGLVAEGETLDEVVAIAEDIARILLELEKEKKEKNFELKSIPQNFEYPLILEM